MRRTTRRKLLAYTGGGIASFGALYWTHGREPVVETTRVTLGPAQFSPRNIHVDTGAQVTWNNTENYPHKLIPKGGWELQEGGGGEGVEVGGNSSFTHTFEESGAYNMFCSIHGSPDMTGMAMKIAVGDAEIQNPIGTWF